MIRIIQNRYFYLSFSIVIFSWVFYFSTKAVAQERDRFSKSNKQSIIELIYYCDNERTVLDQFQFSDVNPGDCFYPFPGVQITILSEEDYLKLKASPFPYSILTSA